jgi:biopolymer transport protein ExbB
MVKQIQIMVLATLVWACLFGTSHAWWHEDWQYRKKIGLDATPAGADIKGNLKDVPLLIRLHTGNFNFGNARTDGSDIRFVSSDDKVPLKFHIERFDSLDEIALIWVKVPRISAGSNAEFLWMYYGNESAVGGQDAAGTYDVNQLVVYHLDETDGMPQDSTAYGNHASAFMGGLALPSVIGNGISLNGAGDQITIAPAAPFDFANGFTFSTWLRLSGPVGDAHLFSAQDRSGGITVAIEETIVYATVTSNGETTVTEKSVDMPLNSWQKLTVTAAPNGRLTIYVDGQELTWVDLSASLPEAVSEIMIGGSPEGEHFFGGELDEIRISNLTRTAPWIRTLYASQGPEGLLLNFGQEELNDTGGLPTFYLGTVAKNITLDGWMVIGILMLIAGASWAVFFSKAMSLRFTNRENETFLEAFAQAPSPVELKADEEDYSYSSLYRIYQAGMKESKKWIGNPHPKPEGLSPKAMKSITAVLEKGYVQETRKLNAWMVLLTIAITGGPFLGLLGTVWGVMNTFAAMAEAGEANIMAIAPGVASALSTTVFGLIVAIPALFGYNYLATQVKAITADLGVFIDEFTVRLEQLGNSEQ